MFDTEANGLRRMGDATIPRRRVAYRQHSYLGGHANEILRHLRSGSQLVEIEDALPGGRQKLRWHPFCLICRDTRQPAQIDRVKLHSSNVEELTADPRTTFAQIFCAN